MANIRKPDANPIVAVLLCFLLMSGIFFVNGQKTKWLVTLVAVVVGNFLCCPGVIIAVLAMIDAYMTAEKLKQGQEIGEHEFSFEPCYKVMKLFYKDATFVPPGTTGAAQ